MKSITHERLLAKRTQICHRLLMKSMDMAWAVDERHRFIKGC